MDKRIVTSYEEPDLGHYDSLSMIKLGELSLPIYIFSTLICTIFFLVFSKFNAITPLNGIISQVMITVISYYIALLLYKIPVIRKRILVWFYWDLQH